MRKITEEQWLTIKQSYPIGYKFSATVIKTRPFGIFVQANQTKPRCTGLVEIIQPNLYKEITKELPYDYSQRSPEGSEINCIVCSYRDRNRQLGLGWLNNQ